MMYANPEGVIVDNILEAKGFVGVFDEEATRKIFENGIYSISPIGVLGDPTEASREHGREYIEAVVSAIIDYIQSQ